MNAAHGEIGLGGPGLWIILGILVLTGVVAAVLTLDVARRVWNSRRALLMVWAAPQLAYLVALAWGFASRGAESSARPILVTLVVAIPVQVAYVLRFALQKRVQEEHDQEHGEVLQATLPDDGQLEPRST